MQLTRCLSTRLLVGVTAVAVPVGLMAPSAAAAAAKVVPAKAAPVDRTSAREAKRVDRVPTPKLAWYSVTTRPNAPQPGSAGLRPAEGRQRADRDPAGQSRDQKHKIGSLFVNPAAPADRYRDRAGRARVS